MGMLGGGFAQGYHRFHEGNSLTGGVRELFTELAHDGGFPDDSYEIIGAAGTPVDWAWENLTSNFLETLEANAPYDFIQVQPFRQRWNPEDEGDAAAQIYTTALNHSPNCTLLVYYTWVGSPSRYASFDEWKAELNRYITTVLEPMTDLLQQYFPDNSVYIVPTSPAVLALQDSIEAGKLPNYTNVGDLYHDGIHWNANGSYLNACVHYAAIYQQSPEGLPHTYTVSPAIYTQDVTLTDEEAAIFQRTAWDVVRTHSRTLVTKTARPRSDTEPPSRVTGMAVSGLTPKGFNLSWDECSDNVGVQQYFIHALPVSRAMETFATYRWVGDATGTSKEVTGSVKPPIQPGVTYSVYMRARDAEYNLSPVSDTLTVEVPATVKGDSLMFDFGTGGSPVMDTYTEVVVTEVYTPENGYGYNSIGNVSDRDASAVGDALFRDEHRYFGGSEFLIDLDNGRYTVNVLFGEGDDVDVYAEDSLMLDNVTTAAGRTDRRSLVVDVSDGQLSIRFDDDGGRGWFGIAGIEVVAPPRAHEMRLGAAASGISVWCDSRAAAITAIAPGAGDVRCELLDLRGRALRSQRSRGEKLVLTTRALPSGMYLLRVRSAELVSEMRIMIP